MTTRSLFLLLGAVALTACGESKQKTAATDTTKAAPPPATNTATMTAPAVFRVRFETSKGPFVVESRRNWAPIGADRFYTLAKSNFYDNGRFFRVIPNFVVQFGMHADPKVGEAWDPLKITDDPVTQSNKRGFVTFATSGANSRGTQLFINLKDNANLDGMGFAPIGFVVSGMSVVDSLYSAYGEDSDNQGRIRAEGNTFLDKEFPKLDFIRTARVEESPVVADSSAKKGGTPKKE